MDPRNGEILAMVSWPSYDNSRFARTIDVDYYFDQFDDPLRPLVNHAISALYPPGSVWKLITAMGVVEEGVIDPEQELYDPGQLVLPNEYAPLEQGRSQTFVCWLRTGHKAVNLIHGIAWSCDVYFYQVGGGNPDVSKATLREGGLGIYDLYRWATSFGIGSRLGVELPGELAGRMPERQWKRRNYGESWSTGDTYNAAFGQGYVTVTPLQLLSAVSAIINGGTLYQPTIIQNLQDASGTILQDFEPNVIRTVVPKTGEDVILTLQEDMLVNGEFSLACRCEEDSGFYDEAQCNPESYRSNFDRDPNIEDDVVDLVQYRVNVPPGYTFNSSVCNELEFRDLSRNEPYIPPLADAGTIALIQTGMREAVTDGGGTAKTAALTYVNVAGKTGTAEYCDDVAFPLGLCVQGQWPAHAWYIGYAPYENPEIAILAFVYNGDEGSAVALPIVRDVMDAYFRLKITRGQQ
jgi:penicillin-binding protein 2